MNSAVLQGTIMATTSHGIHRLNRHRNPVDSNRRRVPSLRTLIRRRRQSAYRNNGDAYNLDSNEDSLQSLLFVTHHGKNIKEPAEFDGHKPLLRLNVGGTSFTLRYETIRRRNSGFLCNFIRMTHEQRVQISDDFFETANEYYFERSSALFNVIYQYYITGLIHQSTQICSQDLLDELEYWRIDASPALAPCCCSEDRSADDANNQYNLSKRADSLSEFKRLPFGELRYKIWQIIEQPSSSVYAQIFGSLSVLFVLVSISALILGSIPELQVNVGPVRDNNASDEFSEFEPHPILDNIEYVCISWFLFEYITKMLVSANRIKTFLELLSIVDLLSILPFMVEMSLMLAGINTEKLRNFKGALLVMRILRVLRVVRILKLGRYSSGLQLFGKTLKASFRQLGMMAMVVMTGVIFFSTLVYFLEKDEPNTQFVSIPAAMWWSLVTMTTVGYGDITPITVCGKLVATVAICAGVLVLALPITIIVDNFMKVAEAERQSELLEEPIKNYETSQNPKSIIPSDPTNSPLRISPNIANTFE